LEAKDLTKSMVSILLTKIFTQNKNVGMLSRACW